MSTRVIMLKDKNDRLKPVSVWSLINARLNVQCLNEKYAKEYLNELSKEGLTWESGDDLNSKTLYSGDNIYQIADKNYANGDYDFAVLAPNKSMYEDVDIYTYIGVETYEDYDIDREYEPNTKGVYGNSKIDIPLDKEELTIIDLEVGKTYKELYYVQNFDYDIYRLSVDGTSLQIKDKSSGDWYNVGLSVSKIKNMRFVEVNKELENYEDIIQIDDIYYFPSYADIEGFNDFNWESDTVDKLIAKRVGIYRTKEEAIKKAREYGWVE